MHLHIFISEGKCKIKTRYCAVGEFGHRETWLPAALQRDCSL